MRKKETRFAVGAAGDQLSPVWKIWTQKNDVYLTARMSGGFLKISLHNDDPGVWLTAMTQESGVKAPHGGRSIGRWDRPAEFQPGWTRGPHIAVVRLARHDHAPFEEQPTKANLIEWIPKPDPDCKAVIAVFFGAPEKTLEDFSQILATGEGYFTDHLELADGRKVFIMFRYDPLNQGDAPTVNYLQSQADEWTAVNDDLRGCLAIFMQAPPVPWVCILKFASPPNFWRANAYSS